MIHTPNSVFVQYEVVLKKREIPPAQYADYMKWVRYYLDFCAKYLTTDDKSERKQLFLKKLEEKKQTNIQMKQAAHAISLYFEMQRPVAPQGKAVEEPAPLQGPNAAPEQAASAPASTVPILQQSYVRQRQSQYCAAGYEEKSASPEWDDLLALLAGEIKVRHYSRNTLRTYAHWSRQFQRFLKNKPPSESPRFLIQS